MVTNLCSIRLSSVPIAIFRRDAPQLMPGSTFRHVDSFPNDIAVDFVCHRRHSALGDRVTTTLVVFFLVFILDVTTPISRALLT